MQRRGVVPVAVRLYNDLNIPIQLDEKAQKPFNRELAELAAEHLGYVRLANTKQGSSVSLFHPLLFHDGVDFEHQLRLNQMLIRIWHSEILEAIPLPDFVAFFVHGCVPFAIRSAPYPGAAFPVRSWISSQLSDVPREVAARMSPVSKPVLCETGPQPSFAEEAEAPGANQRQKRWLILWPI
jgi:hypothetical protein